MELTCNSYDVKFAWTYFQVNVSIEERLNALLNQIHMRQYWHFHCVTKLLLQNILFKSTINTSSSISYENI